MLGDCEKNLVTVGKYSKSWFRNPTFTFTNFTGTDLPTLESNESPRLEIEDDDVSDPVSDELPPAPEPEPAMAAPVRHFAPLPEGFTQNAYEVGLEASQTLSFLDVVHV